ncbi:TPA: LacI family DNA-binding transcriptional regulator [Streptococcus suis]|uniref:LacI family DNA-binding transcriptional regulator n=1 Tax=Streptococcus suis TaxID=1307 RepID=UPI001ABECC77|nr:LacI family DNA-binding transcriptional regulator [Streptococcus suis]MBO4110280.1 LacI family DNA-binding transcriptional regulator [Streptococcus suis]HEM3612728.1 LacI family DNA-binding transcriptional regulator [Streptococcus suis]HEM3614137.1 LacI family DNA-binding transcriptional regulator [Streptococcus suis]HEM3622173.1 LacI family DNA-binding transcriptional regulator [Streptococcus suis]HEM3626641.1 LacI family DNA-binding transcriptional regulator [Streptococcus suis]
MKRKKNSYTIYDIAKISGFSPKTVSRVINSEESVKAETREKIEEVICRLSYSPNVYAKNLSKKTVTNILISIKKRDAFPLIWFQTLLDKLLVSCKEIGINAIVEYYNSDDDIVESIIHTSGSFIDGVIVFYEDENDLRLDYLKKNQVPCIVFGKGFQKDVLYVSNDDYGALYHLMDKLSLSKIKTMWLLMGGKNSVNMERVRGAEEWLEQHSSEVELETIYGLSTIESVYSYSYNHLTKDHHPDVIFVSGDEKVQGLIKACQEKNIDIPNDVSVIGFDNIPISQYYTPSLTTIAPDYVELSKQILTCLIKKINGLTVDSVEVSTSLIIRQSTKDLLK